MLLSPWDPELGWVISEGKDTPLGIHLNPPPLTVFSADTTLHVKQKAFTMGL